MIRRMVGGRFGALLTLAALVFVSPLFAPQLLAFPHKARAGDSMVWSESPIPAPALERVMARSEALTAASPLARASEPRRIFITEGGWRWSWLSASAAGSFALTRPFTDPVIIVNNADFPADRATNGRRAGGVRRLSSVIAHETTHGMIRRHFGRLTLVDKPQWLVEGYCDYIAQESALSAAQVADLEGSGTDHPALPYFHGRRKVAAILAANGGDVDALFAGN